MNMADSTDRVFSRISETPITAAAIEDFVRTSEYGAIVTFHGVVRDHDDDRSVTALDYQAHPEAERFLRECCEHIAERTGLRVAAVHRTGPLVVGDTALIASVAAPHRREAFDACAELVDEIKHTVPIWKRQHFVEGPSVWVGL
jgi:molybdopterin synthase catalytic subunit